MKTIISENKKESINFYASSFELSDGDMLILANQETIDELGEWIGKHGVYGIYGNPEYLDEYKDFIFVELVNGKTAIRLYK